MPGDSLKPLESHNFVTDKEYNLLIRSLCTVDASPSKAARNFLIPRNLCIIHLMRYYGLTPTKISNLKMQHLNFGQDTLDIYNKNGSIYTFNLSRDSKKLIMDYLDTFPDVNRPRIRTVDPIFVSYNNRSMGYQVNYNVMPTSLKQISVRAIQKTLLEEVRASGIDMSITTTNLRNTAIMDAFKNDLPEDEIRNRFELPSAYALRRYKEYFSKLTPS